MIRKILHRLLVGIHNPIRTVFQRIGLHNYSLNDELPVGYLKEGLDVEDLTVFLKAHGFEINKLAWVAPGEVLNMRLRVHKKYQYHVRCFKDGEVTGHYEFTPERKPISHLLQYNKKHDSEYFHNLLGDVIEAK